MRRERRTVRASGFVPVEAKLQPARPQDGFVLRGQLVDRLVDSAGYPVVVVSAAPGYGKTALVAQWAEEDARPFAWLTLDPGDNDPVVLITYLLLALHRIEPVDATILAATAAAPSLAPVLPRLGTMLRGRDPFVLVLDDAHTLTAEAALRVVDAVARHLPPGGQLALVGRHPPPLELPAGRVMRLGGADLRLSRAEAAAVVRAARSTASADDVAALLDRTEGWAAGIYLATLPAKATANGRHRPHDPNGGDRLVDDYLRDEVLTPLPRRDQTFLTRISILEQLSGPLCDAVLMSTGSARTLERLAESDLFVTRTADAGWFRLHPQFATALRAELTRREPRLVKPLHARAGRWLEEAGRLDEATEHAVAAGEVARAGRLIWTLVPRYLAQGRLPALQALLDRFTPQQLAGHAKLALAAAACALQRGEPADLWVTSAENGRYEADRPGEPESVAGATALLRAALARNGVVQMGADARLAAGLLAPDDPWLCTVHAISAIAAVLTGDGTARPALEAVERRATATGVPQCGALALSQLALLAVQDDHWPEAHHLVERAHALCRTHGLGSLTTLLPLRCVTTLLVAHDAKPDEALALVRRCLASLAEVRQPPAWIAVQCRQVLARSELLLGDTAAARTLLSEAQSLLPEVSDATALQAEVERAWREVQQLPLELDAGASTLTTAELRVLQFLPTHLSFEEIGRQLYVSRNTVKTQAVAAYRKLGVNSRAEAVERAEALGLLGR